MEESKEIKVPVLCYHSFDYNKNDLYSITSTQFENHLSFLKKQGYQIISVKQFVEGEYDKARKAVILTIDDADKSIIKQAAPILEKHDAKATLFIPTSFINMKGFLNWFEIEELVKRGFDIGSHTRKHTHIIEKFGNETKEQYEERLKREIFNSKNILEKRLNIEIKSFAYPYGEYNEEIQNKVLGSGYSYIFNTNGGFKHSFAGDNKIIFERICVKKHYSPSDILSIINGELVNKEYNPKVSVIIPTYNQSTLLSLCLDSLCRQDYPKEQFEVIVVDDGSDDGTKETVLNIKNNNPLIDINYLSQERKGFRAGAARNKGAKNAKGEILIFIDSDIVVNKDFISKHVISHSDLVEKLVLGYIAGYNFLIFDEFYSLSDIKEHIKNSLKIPVIAERSRENILLNCMDNLARYEKPWSLVYSGNFSINKKLFESIGSFDEGFSGWGMEDSDLGYRLIRKGVILEFSRAAIGHHIIEQDKFNKEGLVRYEKNLFEITTFKDNFKRFIDKYDELNEDEGDFLSKNKGDNKLSLKITDINNIDYEFSKRLQADPVFHTYSLERIKEIAYINSKNTKEVIIVGGEPLVSRDFFKIISILRDFGYEKIALHSNGLLFSYIEMCKKIKNKVDFVIIPFYTHNSSLFDRITGFNGSFKRVVNGIKNLLGLGISVNIEIPLIRENTNDISKTIPFLKNLFGKHHLEIHITTRNPILKDDSYFIPFNEINKLEPSIDSPKENGFKFVIRSVDKDLQEKYPLSRKTFKELKSTKEDKIEFMIKEVKSLLEFYKRHDINNHSIGFLISLLKQLTQENNLFSGMPENHFGSYQKSYLSTLANMPPRMISLETSRKCNAACEMCLLWRDNQKQQQEGLKLEDFKNIISQISAWKPAPLLNLCGPEPMMNKTISFEVMEFTKSKGVEFSIVTNASLLKEEDIKKLISLEPKYVGVSIDGLEKTHNALRGIKAYELTLSNLKKLIEERNLKNSKTKLVCQTIIHNKNLDELIPLINLMEQINVDEIRINPYLPNHNARTKLSSKDNLWIRQDRIEMLKKVIKDIINIKKEGKINIKNTEESLRALIPYFESKGNFNKNQVGFCSSGFEYFHIGYDGNIGMCVFSPDLNVKDRPLKNIWESYEFWLSRIKARACQKGCFDSCYEKYAADTLKPLYRFNDV